MKEDGKVEAAAVHDIDPFDQARNVDGEGHINYKTMGWIKAGALIMAETIALGILSFPLVFHRLGMFGGVFTTVAFALLSWQTGYVLVQFKINHPGVMNFADAGHVIAGKYGFWTFGVMLTVKVRHFGYLRFLLLYPYIRALWRFSLSLSVESRAWLSRRRAGSPLIAGRLSYPRTFEKVSYISFVSVTCILIACFITIVATGRQDPEDLPAFNPAEPVRWKAFENHGLVETINGKHLCSSLTNIIFAYGGHVAIFSFAAEMHTPADFKYSLALVQIVATIFYIIVGATIYAFGGQYVTSPALTMTSKPVRITAYSIALVSIVISGVVASYIAAKFIFLTLFRKSARLTSNSYGTWGIWVAICACIWITGWLIAELIPFFSDLLSIISSILTVWFTYGLSGILWMYDHGPRGPYAADKGGPGFFGGWKAKAGFFTSVFVIVMSAAIMVLGMYSAITSIAENYSSGEYGHPFTC
ncbi:transmembrane amino acid transporter protein-domain-containing protein [Amylostereum chailletii]|nr:transmembrane amino acid transporter protein-domain-containing protein [Amylostereum chailletii]